MPSARDVRAGRAFVEIAADDSSLRRTLAGVQARFAAWGSALSSLGAKILGAGLAGSAVLNSLTVAYASMGDELAKAATRTGVAVERLSALRYAADRSGTDLEGLETGIRKMSRSLEEASLGSGKAVGAMSALGLSAAKLQGLSPDEAFVTIGDAVSRVSDPVRRASLAMDLFGKSGTSLIPLFANGANGVRALTAEAERLGLVMSTRDVRAAEEFGERMGDLWSVLKMSAFTLGAALAPAVREFAVGAANAGAQVNRWISAHRPLVALAGTAATGLTVLGASTIALGLAMQATAPVVGLFGGAIGLVGSAAALSLSPIGLAAGALRGLAGVSLGVVAGGFSAVASGASLMGTAVARAVGLVAGAAASAAALLGSVAGSALTAGVAVAGAAGLVVRGAVAGVGALASLAGAMVGLLPAAGSVLSAMAGVGSTLAAVGREFASAVALIPGVASGVARVAGLFAGAATGIGGFAAQVAGSIASVAGSALSSVLPVLSAVGGAVASAYASVAGVAATAFAAVSSAAGTAFAAVAGVVSTAAASIATVFPVTLGLISTAMAGVAAVAVEAFGTVAAAAVAAAGVIGTTFAGLAVAAAPVLVPFLAIGGAIALVGYVAYRSLDLVGRGVHAVGAALSAVAGDAKTGAQEIGLAVSIAADTARLAAGDIAASGRGAFATIETAAARAARTAWGVLSGLGARLRGVWSVVRADATEAFGGVRDALAAGDWAMGARIVWATLRLEWARGVQGLWNPLATGFHDAMKVVLDGWSYATGAIRTAWSYVVEYLTSWDGIKAAFGNLWSYLEKGWGAIGSYTKAVWDAVARHIADAGQNLGTEILIRQQVGEEYANRFPANHVVTPNEAAQLAEPTIQKHQSQIREHYAGASPALMNEALAGERQHVIDGFVKAFAGKPLTIEHKQLLIDAEVGRRLDDALNGGFRKDLGNADAVFKAGVAGETQADRDHKGEDDRTKITREGEDERTRYAKQAADAIAKLDPLAGSADVAKRQAELDGLLAQAGDSAAKAKAAAVAAQNRATRNPADPSDIGNALSGMQEKYRAVGTFDPRQAGRIGGGGDPLRKIEQHTEKTAIHLSKLIQISRPLVVG